MMSKDSCGKGYMYEETHLESKIGIHFCGFPIFLRRLIPKLVGEKGKCLLARTKNGSGTELSGLKRTSILNGQNGGLSRRKAFKIPQDHDSPFAKLKKVTFFSFAQFLEEQFPGRLVVFLHHRNFEVST